MFGDTGFFCNQIFNTVPLPQLWFFNLSGGVSWNIGKDDFSWPLIPWQCHAERLQFFFGECCFRLHFYDGSRDFAQTGIWQTNDSNVFDCIVLAEEIFNLYRLNIFAAGDDDIFLAVNEIDKAVFVFLCHIAGEQPTIL